MKRAVHHRPSLLAASLSLAAVGAIAPAPPPPPAPPATQSVKPATAPARHTSLKDAYRHALRTGQPILVIVGADWCQPCRALDKEMESPQAARALAGWTLVHLDADTAEEAPAMLESGSIPLLRVLSPAGGRVDVREGLMTADELAGWLDRSREKATAAGGQELIGTGPPSATDLPKLVGRLSDADAAPREAAIKRLAPHADVAAAPVVEAFAKGNLLTRLAALDLLATWNAPVADLDPWKPETVTAERLKSLADWAAAATKAGPTTAPASRPAAPSPKELADARADLARLAAAETEAEALGLRERLARLGASLLPEVRARLADPALADTPRRRLLALRYRLAASDALAVGWPGGFERLAFPDPATRRAAADELVARATPHDAPLLLELFADPDGLIRETGLKGLQAVGKGEAGRALLDLLNDPDLNVRAAVLKQLAQNPAPGMLNAVIDFAKREADGDLVVHAIRVLRESKSARAVDGLLALLPHANWRVRAEAAEALTELAGPRSSSPAREKQAEVYAAMAGLLEDAEPFVVSRAVVALAAADLPSTIEPMVNAARKYPELAADVIRGITSGSKGRAAAEKHLRAFCAHRDEAVRGQAIAALCKVTGEVQAEAKALLNDPAESVRAATASALFALMNSWRPSGQTEQRTESSFFGLSSRVVEQKTDVWKWAAEFKAGKKNRPAWLTELVPDLQKLAAAGSAPVATRLDAALPLLALGQEEQALAILREAPRAEPRLADTAAGALPWLETDRRIELFKFLASTKGKDQGVYHLADAMATLPDPKAAAPIWDLLGSHPETETAGAVVSALQQVYFGERYFSPSEPRPKDAQARAVADAKARLSGPELQRLAALALLLAISPTDAAEAARSAYADTAAPEALRADAFRILLLSQAKAPAEKDAVAALASGPAPARRVAVRFLAGGADEIQYVRDGIFLQYQSTFESSAFVNANAPVVILPPPGLTADLVKPLVGDADQEVAAAAGHLLALLGDRAGLDAVVRLWRAKPDDDDARRLLYRAVAALRDDELTPLLEQVYRGYGKDQSYYLREFYWTIRAVSGEKVLRLRKTIRDEVGMDNLR